jgi:glycosyltransferase involved in cell wall biosynthesis
MKIGVLPEQGGSIENLDRSGQGDRFVENYLRRYARAFEHVYYFSYAADSAVLPERCELVMNRSRLHRWLYALTMPFVHARRFRQCDVLRVMQLTGEVPAVIAKLLYGVPFAATYGYRYAVNARMDGEGWVRSQLFGLRTRIALRLADRIIVTNPDIRAEVVASVGSAKVIMLPNGVDVTIFSPSESSGRAQPSVILFVGRLSPIKNLPLLIDAAALLRHPVIVRLIGVGPLREELKDRAQRLGVHLELPGTVEHRHLPEELRRAAVFVLTSRIEGHPKALLEAMSCGCVCVATSSPGVAEVIQHEQTGLLSAPEPTALAETLERALSDQPLRARLAHNARAHAERDFNIDAIIGREVAMLQDLAQARR